MLLCDHFFIPQSKTRDIYVDKLLLKLHRLSLESTWVLSSILNQICVSNVKKKMSVPKRTFRLK